MLSFGGRITRAGEQLRSPFPQGVLLQRDQPPNTFRGYLDFNFRRSDDNGFRSTPPTTFNCSRIYFYLSPAQVLAGRSTQTFFFDIATTDSSQRDTAFPVHMVTDASSDSESARAPRSALDKLSALLSLTSAMNRPRVHRGNTSFEQVALIPTQIPAGFDFGLRHLPGNHLLRATTFRTMMTHLVRQRPRNFPVSLRDGRIAGPFDYDCLRLQVSSLGSNPLSVIKNDAHPVNRGGVSVNVKHGISGSPRNWLGLCWGAHSPFNPLFPPPPPPPHPPPKVSASLAAAQSAPVA
ncbi:BZ3501_MvSof-1269-A2-R1_Chr11g02996 [Microbotryum saponariae]|nr:BZ3501_MvSof-1269-A2-R1_Chr11g02996 [Microbotryum saponariae]